MLCREGNKDAACIASYLNSYSVSSFEMHNGYVPIMQIMLEFGWISESLNMTAHKYKLGTKTLLLIGNSDRRSRIKQIQLSIIKRSWEKFNIIPISLVLDWWNGLLASF